MKDLKYFIKKYKNVSFKDVNDTVNLFDLESAITIEKERCHYCNKIRYNIIGHVVDRTYLLLIRKEVNYILFLLEEKIQKDLEEREFTDLEDMLYFIDPVKSGFITNK